MPWRTTWPSPGPLTDTAAVDQRGRAAGAALGQDPMAALSALVVRVPERVRAAPAIALMRTPFGDDDLGGLPPDPTLELTVHTCDLAAALGVSADVPQGRTQSSRGRSPNECFGMSSDRSLNESCSPGWRVLNESRLPGRWVLLR